MHYEKIDYYAFTIPTDSPFTSNGEATIEYVISEFLRVTGQHDEFSMDRSTWEIERGGKNYTLRLRHNQTGVALSFGTKNAHIYVELAGGACDAYESIDALLPLVSNTSSRASRIDCAVDYETDETPERFSAFRNTDKWKYAPYYPSESGTTCYVGSRKSERMARVYRYNPPHPRSHLLRVETEYKGKAARALAAMAGIFPLHDIVATAHKPFEWSHSLASNMANSGEKLKYTNYRPSNAATIRWLYSDVAKAVRKAIKNGSLEWDEWVAHIFKKEDRDNPED